MCLTRPFTKPKGGLPCTSVGLDYHQSRSSRLEILDPAGARFKHLEVKGDWTKLLEAVDQQVPKPFAICFEASCGYGHLYDQLAQRAASVEVAHPGDLRLIFRSKRKNDRIDAGKIAKILHLDMVPKVHVPKSRDPPVARLHRVPPDD